MYKVREANIEFTVEKLNKEGKVEQSVKIPVTVFEAQFNVPLEKVAEALLKQHTSPEIEAEVEEMIPEPVNEG